MKNILYIILIISSSLYAKSCWSIEDDANFGYGELSGKINFSFKDAKTCEPISNLKVKFFGQNFTTNASGEITLPVPPDTLDISDTLVAKKSGYITLKQKVSAMVGTFNNQKFLVVKDIAINKAMFVLSWGENPRDLDLHLKSDDFHISYRNKKGDMRQAILDRDAKRGFGPETITLNKLQKHKKYELFVYKYSSKGEYDSSTNVSVYTNGKLNKNVNFYTGMLKRCIKVATIYNNQVTYNMLGVEDKYCK